MASGNKPIVAVDIDEVLAQFIPKLADFHNDIYGGPSLSAESFVSYEFHKVWGGSIEECNQKMEAFFESDYFKERIDPMPHALETLQRMKEKYSLHVVTARQHKVEEVTRSWLSKYFPNIFEDIHFGNHYSTSGKSRSKAEMCKSIGAKVLIDDSLIYATQCALADISVVLFGHYPWNQCIESTSHYHDVTVILNAHERNEVVVQDYREELFLHDQLTQQASNSGPHHVYRVSSWQLVEKAVEYMLSFRKDIVGPAQSISEAEAEERERSFAGNDKLVVAAIQMCSKNDKSQNFLQTSNLIEQAIQAYPGLSLVCLPENSAFLGSSQAETAAAGESLSAPDGYISRLQAIAREKKVWLSVGGFAEKSEELAGSKVYNAHFLIDRNGNLKRPVYHKVHLFDCPLVGLQESKLAASGRSVVVMEVEGWRVGLAVCYDLRFPEFFEAMRGAEGQPLDLLLLPAAFTVPTGAAHWEILLRARAIEQQCYVVAAAQSGQHNERRASYGHSMVIDPWGKIVNQLYTEPEGVCGAVLERSRLAEVRRNLPALEHRRPDVYRST
eukprot:gene3281-3598_t